MSDEYVFHYPCLYKIQYIFYGISMEKPKICLKISIHIRLLLAVTSEDRAELVGDNFVKRRIVTDLYF